MMYRVSQRLMMGVLILASGSLSAHGHEIMGDSCKKAFYFGVIKAISQPLDSLQTVATIGALVTVSHAVYTIAQSLVKYTQQQVEYDRDWALVGEAHVTEM